jgi:sugar phosphate isomerase/epimerase
METLLRRRDVVFAGTALTLGNLAGVAPSPAAGIDPIKRNGKPSMKLSCAAYSFREQLTGKQGPEWSLDNFIEFCANQGLEGTELTGYYFPKEITPQYLTHLKHKCFLLGLDISGTAIANNFCRPPGAERDRELAHVKLWVDYAAAFGAPCIRIFSGDIPQGHTEAESIRWAVEGIEECCHYAGNKGVFLALENHGGISVPADRLLEIVRQIRSPWFGLNLDTGNFHSEDPYAEMAKVAPFAINVQVKTEVTPKGSTKQPANLARVIRILREANYRGYVALEYEAAEDPKTAVPRHLAELRKLIS